MVKNKIRVIIGVICIIGITLVAWSIVDTLREKDYNALGLAEYQKGNYDKAIEYYSKAIESDPSNVMAYHNRGLAYFKTGNWMNMEPFDKAISDYSKAIELKPDYADAYYNRGLARLQFVHFYNMPFGPDVIEKFNGALDDFDKTLELDPDFTLAYAGKGNAYDLHGEFEEATRWYNKALEFKDQIVERWSNDALAGVYTSRARNYMRTEDLEEAVLDYNKSLELEPKDPATLWLTLSHLIAAYWDLEQYNNALDVANELINWLEANPAFCEANPMAYYIWLGRGYSYYKLEKYEEAITDLKKTENLMAWPVPEVYRYMAEVYSGIGDEEKARECYDKTVAICTGLIAKPSPLSPTYVAYNDRGLAYLSLGEYDKAILDLQKVIELSPKTYPYSHVHYYAEGHKNIGIAYSEMGNKEKAREYYERAISVAKEQGLEFTEKKVEELLKEL